MADAKYVFAREGQIFIGYADDQSASVPAGDFDAIGCISGALQVNDSYGTEAVDELDNWCYHQSKGADDIAQLQLGERSIDIAATIEVDLDDPAYEELYDLYTNRTEFQVQIIFEDGHAGQGSTTGKHELVLLGVLDSHPRTARSGAGGGGTAQWDFSFHANEKVYDSLTVGSPAP